MYTPSLTSCSSLAENRSEINSLKFCGCTCIRRNVCVFRTTQAINRTTKTANRMDSDVNRTVHWKILSHTGDQAPEHTSTEKPPLSARLTTLTARLKPFTARLQPLSARTYQHTYKIPRLKGIIFTY